MGLRRSGREAALKILYSVEFSDESIENATSDYWLNHKGSKKMKEFAEKIVTGVEDKKKELDKLIEEAATNWEIERIPVVERNILRVSVYELLECKELPSPVIINEALEIAKEYAGGELASFVNGVLGKIEKDARN